MDVHSYPQGSATALSVDFITPFTIPETLDLTKLTGQIGSLSYRGGSQHIEDFFRSYAPDFQHNLSVNPSSEFDRLCVEMEWNASSAEYRYAIDNFGGALVSQFTQLFGDDVENLEGWQHLCWVLDCNAVPATIGQCRRVSVS